MAAFLDVCRFTPSAGGTTDWTYAVAVTGYQGPAAAGAVNGTIYRYRAESADLSQWEIGYGAYNSSTGVFARTTVLYNSSGTTSKISFSTVPQVAIVAIKEDLISIEEANSFTATQKARAISNLNVSGVTFTSLTSGSGNYSPPANCTWTEVLWVGGGGGGAGCSATASTGGSAGTKTTFNGIDAAPGGGAAGAGVGNAASGGAGGSGGAGSATGLIRMAGQAGIPASVISGSIANPNGPGGSSVLFGGGGAGGAIGSVAASGSAGAINSGGGGGGGYVNSTDYVPGAGGGAGESCSLIINAPTGPYAYSIGSGGAGGSSTANGGNGAAGQIFIIEHYGLP